MRRSGATRVPKGQKGQMAEGKVREKSIQRQVRHEQEGEAQVQGHLLWGAVHKAGQVWLIFEWLELRRLPLPASLDFVRVCYVLLC